MTKRDNLNDEFRTLAAQAVEMFEKGDAQECGCWILDMLDAKYKLQMLQNEMKGVPND